MNTLRRVSWFGLASFLIALGVGVALATPGWPGWAVLGPAIGALLGGLGLGLSVVGVVLSRNEKAKPDGQDVRHTQEDATRALSGQLLADSVFFDNNFSPGARGRALERSLLVVDEAVPARQGAALPLIHNVRSPEVRDAATSFYRAWADVAAHFDDAVDREVEQKRSGRILDGPTAADLVGSATAALHNYQEAADAYLDAITPNSAGTLRGPSETGR